jgi:hypothetical protein
MDRHVLGPALAVPFVKFRPAWFFHDPDLLCGECSPKNACFSAAGMRTSGLV